MQELKRRNLEITAEYCREVLSSFEYIRDNMLVDYAAGNVSSPEALDSLISKFRHFCSSSDGDNLKIPLNELEWIDLILFLYVAQDNEPDQGRSERLYDLYHELDKTVEEKFEQNSSQA